MYDYYLDQSKGITRKAENDRGKLARLLDLVKQIRLYDLKRIRNKELEDTNLNLVGLKKNWTGVKASLQTKVKFVEDIQRRHREEIQTYEEFCDYLEPGSLKDKIKLQIQDMRRERQAAKIPINEMLGEKQRLQRERDRLTEDLKEREQKNQKLREHVERSEMEKASSS